MRIEVTQDVFQLAQVFTISRGSRTQAQVLTVRITDGDVVGWGECVPYARYGETMQSVTDQIGTLPEKVSRADLYDLLPAGAARNAVDCALWDLEAKRAGKRVWDLVGMAAPQPVMTAYTLSLDTPDKMEAQAAKNNHRPLLKIKLGTPDDMDRLEAVRRGACCARIIVDANEGWTPEVYADLAPHLVRLGVEMVEQPLPAGDDDALREMERPVPICADESCHDLSTIHGLDGKYDMMNIKLDKAGGLTEALAMRAAAAVKGIDVMVGCMVGSSLAMAPAILVAQGASIVDLDGPLLLATDRETPLLFDSEGVHPPSAALWG